MIRVSVRVVSGSASGSESRSGVCQGQDVSQVLGDGWDQDKGQGKGQSQVYGQGGKGESQNKGKTVRVKVR